MKTGFFTPWLHRAALGAIALVFAAAAMSGAAAAAEKVRAAAAVSWPGYAFWELAKRAGLMDDIELEFLFMNDPLGGTSMLAAGQLDVYVNTVDYVPIGIEQNLPIVNVAYTNLSYGVDQIITAPGITAETIPGKRVSAPQAFIGHLQMGVWLESQGIAVGDVDWVDMNADEAAGAMLAGDIAAGYLYEPWATSVIENMAGSARVANTAELLFTEGGMFADSMYMNKDFVANRRDVALRMLQAHWDGVRWWKENPEEANAIWTEFLEWPSEDVAYVVGHDGTGLDDATLYPYTFEESARFCGVLAGDPPFGQKNGQFADTVKLTNEWWIRLGLMNGEVDPAAGLDCSLMKELVDSGYRG